MTILPANNCFVENIILNIKVISNLLLVISTLQVPVKLSVMTLQTKPLSEYQSGLNISFTKSDKVPQSLNKPIMSSSSPIMSPSSPSSSHEETPKSITNDSPGTGPYLRELSRTIMETSSFHWTWVMKSFHFIEHE